MKCRQIQQSTVKAVKVSLPQAKKDALSVLASKMKAATEEVEALRKEKAILPGEIADLKKQSKMAETELDLLNSDVKSVKDKETKIKKDIEEMGFLIVANKEEIEDTTEELAGLLMKAKNALSEVNKQEAINEALKNEIDSNKQLLATKLCDLESEIDTKSKKLSEVKIQKEGLEKDVKSYTTTLKKTRTELAKTEAEMNDKGIELVNATQELDVLKVVNDNTVKEVEKQLKSIEDAVEKKDTVLDGRSTRIKKSMESLKERERLFNHRKEELMRHIAVLKTDDAKVAKVLNQIEKL